MRSAANNHVKMANVSRRVPDTNVRTATPQYMICGQKVRARDRPRPSKNSASGASDRLSPRVFRAQALQSEMRSALCYLRLDAHSNWSVLHENLDPTVPHMPTSLSSVDRQTG